MLCSCSHRAVKTILRVRERKYVGPATVLVVLAARRAPRSFASSCVTNSRFLQVAKRDRRLVSARQVGVPNRYFLCRSLARKTGMISSIDLSSLRLRGSDIRKAPIQFHSVSACEGPSQTLVVRGSEQIAPYCATCSFLS